ncbi:MAG: Rpn family recombination-promoting nuclease/putative transposase [Spirochaetales bacterium]|jgi:predicted transposase/invertase (TIGR01784 family)|nr:Rpn family recombination-promoting nuclease/putative transposase [Spirochaetales bacterium]
MDDTPLVTGRLNPLNDYLFMRMMGEKGDEQQLSGFLNAVLRRTGKDKLISVEILENKIFTAEILGNKSSVLDIRAVLPDGTKTNIEVQLRNLGNMDKRSLFYWCLEYIQGIEAGQDYLELPNVIAINIVNFQFINSQNFHTTFHLWEDTDKDCLLTDALEIHFVDMAKFRRLGKKDIKQDPLHRWLSYFDKDSPPEIVEEVIKMDQAIQKAQEKVSHVSLDKEALRAYKMREMALSDWTSGINYAKQEGLQKGLQAGRQESKLETARNMKADGEPVSKIIKYTGLTEQQIKEL